MILLDTNVVSAFMVPYAYPVLAAFSVKYAVDQLGLPSVALAEVRYGIEKLPIGRRRNDLEAQLKNWLAAGFGDRVVPFDAASAAHYGIIRARRDRLGRSISLADAMIGATALANGAELATRNTRDFDDYGLTLVNPWSSG